MKMVDKTQKDIEYLKSKIVCYPNFPKPGIMFKDVFSLLREPDCLEKVVDVFSEYISATGAEAIVGLEARGFLIGCAVAYKLKLPFIPIRKKGKLPGKKFSYKYDLEYGQDEFELQQDSLKTDQKVVIVDDLIATGGSCCAAIELIKMAKADPIECVVLIELQDLNWSEKVKIKTTSFLKF